MRPEFIKPQTIYLADNGRAICTHCAGHSARYTGRDISGQAIMEIAPFMIHAGIFQLPLVCECGKTSIESA